MKIRKIPWLRKLVEQYCEDQARREYRDRGHVRNERAVEYRFLFQALARFSPKWVLDVGSGISSLPHLLSTCGFEVEALDKISGYYKDHVFNRHFPLRIDDITRPRLAEQFEFISCVSVLEHIPDHGAAVRGLFQLLAPGGHLVLTFPYHERTYVANAYEMPSSSYYGKGYTNICQMFSRHELEQWLAQNPGRLLEQEYWQCFTGEFWTHGERLAPLRPATAEQSHHLTCLLIQKFA